MANTTVNVDIYAKTTNTDNAWIPAPISKQSPVLNYDIDLDTILSLLNFSNIWIYDSSTKRIISKSNLNKYFPEYNPGGSGGGSVALPVASQNQLGGVKIGNGINVTADGTISVDEQNIPIATTTTLGGVIVGDGLSIETSGQNKGKLSTKSMTGATESNDGESGTVPKPVVGDQNKFLRGDGRWVTIDDSGSTYTLSGSIGTSSDANKFVVTLTDEETSEESTAKIPVFNGATSNSSGEIGLVPKPASGETEKFLKSDGTWSDSINFQQAESRIKIESGDSLAVIFGKISKYLDDLHKVAFTGDYNDLINKPGPIQVLYGIKVDKNNSDPATRVSYTDDAVGMTPAHMNYDTGEFEMGSWGDKFFVVNNYPAMVTFAGSIDYKLSKDDHAYKEDGVTQSDVANQSYEGNAMSVFDCVIWIKAWDDNDYEYYQIANYQADEDFKAYPYFRPDGTMANKLYYPMYKGALVDGKLRSISGILPQYNSTAAQEVSYAQACGAGWSICDFAHRVWLNIMLLMISCHDDSQTAFGSGNEYGYNSKDVDATSTYGWHLSGYMNDKGQFYGYRAPTYGQGNKPVKVFYIEDWWGKRFDRCLGLWNNSGKMTVKWVPPYSASSADGEDTGLTAPSSNYQKTNSAEWGRLPVTTGGSATTYNCDYFYSNNSGLKLALCGGHSSNGSYCGAWYVYLGIDASYSYWLIGASPYLISPIE